MNATIDELAGIVDLFGGLTRAELREALSEVAFRADGQSVATEAFESTLAEALESFAIVAFERNDRTLFVSGPTAFPTTPEHAEDLPHILDVEAREFERGALGHRVADRFGEAVTNALEAEDVDRAEWLVDVSYDVEAWAPVELDDERDRLDELLTDR